VKLNLVRLAAIGTAACICTTGSVHAQSSSGDGSPTSDTTTSLTTRADDNAMPSDGSNGYGDRQFHVARSGDTRNTGNTPNPGFDGPRPPGATDPHGTMQTNDASNSTASQRVGSSDTGTDATGSGR
jgi:hypothetical protein